MDKFNRRPSRKARARKAIFFVAAFMLAAGCFAVLIVFKNASIPWFLGLYVFSWTLAFLAWRQGVIRNYRLWFSGLKFQDVQGPGFSTLEVAAINELLAVAGPDAGLLRRHFEDAEVVARYNSGVGGVTTFRSQHPRSPVSDITNHVSWFLVDDLRAVVGAQFWADETGVLVMLEVFTGGLDTRAFDWTKVSFATAPEELPKPSIPSMPPLITEPHWVYWRPLPE
ncbi:hypothetical protein [Brevundimonas sp. TSRC1-1]|uniref:hypothetical protein n=1 Tax=Brevundimonas sp. TSRC1-1 TaxID=2804562 RepID=UPI003CF1F144